MQAGLLDTYRSPLRNRGAPAWVASLALFAFYLLLYLPGSAFTPNFPDLISPVATALGFPSKWFLYGALYSAAMLVGARAMLRRHGNSRYHRVRTAVLVCVQVSLAFALPLVLRAAGQPELYLSYLWPLSWDKLFPHTLGQLPGYAAAWFVVGSLVVAPALAFTKGKRFYCSWICGCGGLAETFGDPWRHLSDRSHRAWRIERISIHGVLALIVALTALTWLRAAGALPAGSHAALDGATSLYGFFIGAVFSGVLGVGLYPLMGTRVWCRFGCPMAALLGLFQRAGHFRVTVKKDLCIGCGNCSTYCEMGIDVRAYAMANTDVRRASCVGCGMCAHVCPRGVLRLETRRDARTGEPAAGWVLDL